MKAVNPRLDRKGDRQVAAFVFRVDRNALFHYEDSDINYSSRKLIEYTGEEMNLCIYWPVEEFLYPGDYRVDIFADNYLIGSRNFELKK